MKPAPPQRRRRGPARAKHHTILPWCRLQTVARSAATMRPPWVPERTAYPQLRLQIPVLPAVVHVIVAWPATRLLRTPPQDW